ncbi:uncharacterized protein LOC131220144 [Magnolia sinica]|uniref:uncharacterized protein LOC131220144 n=1 Tax=Magnolia sinica TaxID=86752 RepID=UPI002659A793|nr:uncharacterized protein LOC131220144 [Magnolia sinica]
MVWTAKIESRSSLWADYVTSRYGHLQQSTLASPLSPPSPLWKHVLSLSPVLNRNLQWKVGRGSINLWHNNWTGIGRLADWATQPIPDDMLHMSVSDFVSHDGINPQSPDFDLLPTGDLDHIIQAGIYTSDQSDCLVWPHNRSGIYIVKSRWAVCRIVGQGIVWAKRIWDPKIPYKISTFLWRIFQGAIPTDDRVQSRGISLTSRCVCCDDEQDFSPCESLERLFIKGALASKVWKEFSDNFYLLIPLSPLIGNRFFLWWHSNLPSGRPHLLRRITPCLIVWELWKARNATKFDGTLPNSRKVINRVRWLIGKMFAGSPTSHHTFHWLGIPINPPLPKSYHFVKWDRPLGGLVKLNVDGAAASNPGPSGVGGVCRDSNGDLIFVFYSGYGVGSNNWAEL